MNILLDIVVTVPCLTLLQPACDYHAFLSYGVGCSDERNENMLIGLWILEILSNLQATWKEQCHCCSTAASASLICHTPSTMLEWWLVPTTSLKVVKSVLATSCWLRCTVVRTFVFDRRTFPVPRSTCSWRVTTYVGKSSAIGQPTRLTRPFILLRWTNCVVNYIGCVPPRFGGAIWYMLTE